MKFLTTLSVPLLFAAVLPLSTEQVSAQEEVVRESISCVSTNRQRTECPVDGQIQNVRQTSAFAGGFCIQGFSWGYDQNKVWVDIGCSGTFEVDAVRTVAAAPRPDRETVVQTVDCKSSGSARERCRVDGQIQDVEPVGSFSSVPCRYGTSWGYEKRHVWVEKGCQARFSVTYEKRQQSPAPDPEPVEVTTAEPSKGSVEGGLSSASAAAIVAQGACTGLYPSLSAGGYVFSVPRQCSKDAADCKSICEGLRPTVANRNQRRVLRNRQFSCFNSVHVYDVAPAASLASAGTQTYVYNSCRGGCGPNYCCCSAQ